MREKTLWLGTVLRFLAAKGSTYGLPTVVPWFFCAQKIVDVTVVHGIDTNAEAPAIQRMGFNMIQFLAKSTRVSGITGCRREFPRHLLHRITTLAFWTLAALFTQTLYTASLKAESTIVQTSF